jgi:hypothetical protein
MSSIFALSFKQNQTRLERNALMRKIIVAEFVFLDGVIQATGRPAVSTDDQELIGGPEPQWGARSATAQTDGDPIRAGMGAMVAIAWGSSNFPLRKSHFAKAAPHNVASVSEPKEAGGIFRSLACPNRWWPTKDQKIAE